MNWRRSTNGLAQRSLPSAWTPSSTCTRTTRDFLVAGMPMIRGREAISATTTCGSPLLSLLPAPLNLYARGRIFVFVNARLEIIGRAGFILCERSGIRGHENERRCGENRARLEKSPGSSELSRIVRRDRARVNRTGLFVRLAASTLEPARHACIRGCLQDQVHGRERRSTTSRALDSAWVSVA